jgi:hypothetical protein
MDAPAREWTQEGPDQRRVDVLGQEVRRALVVRPEEESLGAIPAVGIGDPKQVGGEVAAQHRDVAGEVALGELLGRAGPDGALGDREQARVPRGALRKLVLQPHRRAPLVAFAVEESGAPGGLAQVSDQTGVDGRIGGEGQDGVPLGVVHGPLEALSQGEVVPGPPQWQGVDQLRRQRGRNRRTAGELHAHFAEARAGLEKSAQQAFEQGHGEHADFAARHRRVDPDSQGEILGLSVRRRSDRRSRGRTGIPADGAQNVGHGDRRVNPGSLRRTGGRGRPSARRRPRRARRSTR